MDTKARIDHLIGLIRAEDGVSQAVADAIRAVPRHLFIPTVALATPSDGKPFVIDRDANPVGWWDAVYSPHPIVTQLDDGATDIRHGRGDYSSSASSPSTVADLLRLADIKPGHRVLEVGTGTGWTAALLSHLVGGHGEVTSIEVDAAVAEQAEKNLSGAGFQPRLLVGDGALGCADEAPYDRVHVTCGVRTVPYSWVEQTRPGGLIVTPYNPAFGDDHSLRLTVTPDGTAVGRIAGYAGYMLMRSQRFEQGRPARTPKEKHYPTTRVDPRTIGDVPAGATLAMATLTGLACHAGYDGEEYRTYLSDPGDPHSWAVATWRPGADEYEVFQVGERPLWEEVVDAYFRWVSWGSPHYSRYGITVRPEGQAIWLDRPDNVLNHQQA
ncbi:methyltransferase domain-containing protein [Nonomuraea purpurea]|uniref:Protein-L-isoaspartate O-methyltransferase n=1 Tax=Nonomuraea purpurea TaxID=1849276 RepID=A0ABV8FVZ8_9ACTN